jgi:hypothetical protein
MAKFKVGTKFVFGKGSKNKAFVEFNDLTIGKIYTVDGLDSDNDAFFTDDDGNRRYANLMAQNEDCKITKIVD